MKTGLLASTALGGSGTGPSGFVGQEAPEEEDQAPNVSPQEQQQYDAFVKNGMEIIYTEDGKVNPEVTKRLSTGDKPMDTLAQTSVWLVMMLEQNAKQAGTELSDDVLMHGGKELFEQLVEIDDALGIHNFKQAELQGAWYQALDIYREANSDEGDRFGGAGGEEAAGLFSELNQADQEGRADEMMPGFYQMSEDAITRAKADQNDVGDKGTQDDEEVRLNDKVTGRG